MKITKAYSMCLCVALLCANVHAKISVQTDAFSKAVTAVSDVVTLDNGCEGVIQCLVNLNHFTAAMVGVLDPANGLVSHCLRIDYYGEAWFMFDEAWDATGTKLPFVPLDRRIGSPFHRAGVTESMCIRVSLPYLETASVGGQKFKIQGRGKGFVFELPGAFFAEYKEAIKTWPVTLDPIKRVVLGVQVVEAALAKVPTSPTHGSFQLAIVSVTPFGLAERSGLLVGDVIVLLDGKPFSSLGDVSKVAQGWTKATPGQVTIWRGGEAINVTVVPE